MKCSICDYLIDTMEKREISVFRVKILNGISYFRENLIVNIPVVIMLKCHEIHTMNVIAHSFVLFIGREIAMFIENFALHRNDFIQRSKSIMSDIFCEWYLKSETKS
jgi:hypothetical protein